MAHAERPAPRGQRSAPASTLTPTPSAMFSSRTSPVDQPSGTSRLNSTTTNTVKLACPTTKCTAPGRVPGQEDRDRQDRPTARRCLGPDDVHDGRRDREPDGGPGQRLERGHTRPEHAGAQDRQRAEHDPERVLDREQLGDDHGGGEPDGGTDRVVEADGPHVEVGAEQLDGLTSMRAGVDLREVGEVERGELESGGTTHEQRSCWHPRSRRRRRGRGGRRCCAGRRRRRSGRRPARAARTRARSIRRSWSWRGRRDRLEVDHGMGIAVDRPGRALEHGRHRVGEQLRTRAVVVVRAHLADEARAAQESDDQTAQCPVAFRPARGTVDDVDRAFVQVVDRRVDRASMLGELAGITADGERAGEVGRSRHRPSSTHGAPATGRVPARGPPPRRPRPRPREPSRARARPAGRPAPAP